MNPELALWPAQLRQDSINYMNVVRSYSTTTLLLQNLGALAASYWLVNRTSTSNLGLSVGPSAFCHSWTQQASIYNWQVTMLTTQDDLFEGNKRRQIILSELPNFYSRFATTFGVPNG